MTPTWYAVWVEVNGHYPQIQHEYDDLDSLAESVAEFLRSLPTEMDTATWTVSVAPHWCDGKSDCDCSDRTPEVIIERFRGPTIGDLELRR